MVKNYKQRTVCILGVIFLFIFALLPYVHMRLVTGVEWQGAPTTLVPDSTYYFAQMREVLDGYPKAGNPYIFEYRDMPAPAFFVPVDIAALPLLLNFSWSQALVFNWFVWGGIFIFLCFSLLRSLNLSTYNALFSTFLAFIVGYMFISRPVAMQIVFPAYLLFLWTLVIWMKAERKTWKHHSALALVIALSAYVYTYLAFIVVSTMVFYWLYIVAKQRWIVLKNLTIVGVLALIAVIPYVFFIFLPQYSNEWYQEALLRIGLIETRLIPLNGWFHSRWVVLGVAMVFILSVGRLVWRKIISSEEADFWYISGAGLLLATVSNLFLGQDLTTAIHIGRFVAVWLAMLVAYVLVRGLLQFKVLHVTQTVALLLIFAICTIGVWRNIPRSVAFISNADKGQMLEAQSYVEPLSFLNQHESDPVVIWANHELSLYTPILSKHYVLFSDMAVLQVMPSDEIFDRYAASRFEPSSTSSIVDDLFYYLGAGYAEEQVNTHNLSVQYCQLLQRHDCAELLNYESFHGGSFFEERYVRAVEVQYKKAAFLREFSVKYLIVDTKHENVPVVNDVELMKIWSNDRYEIYQLQYEESL